jgi:beta-lactam-binding protein with PASTA domain
VPPKCVVPNVVGRLLPAAKRKIRAAHCRVGAVSYRVSTSKRKNHVLAQRPAPRRRLRNGARVNVTVGRGGRR